MINEKNFYSGEIYRNRKDEKREYARELRENPTKSEKLLWESLKNKQLGLRFRRQEVLHGYIADFYCPKRRLIIELDGKFHDKEKDAQRDAHLGWRGYRILRFPSKDVFVKLDEIITTIAEKLEAGGIFG
jgi:very-short-patch-repair endonuclease